MHRQSIAKWGRVGLWSLIAMIALQGVIARYFLPHALYLELLGRNFSEYVPQEIRIQRDLPIIEAVHRLPGLLLLILGMLQFDAGLRRRHPRLHRLSGMAFFAMLLLGIGTALVIVLLMPFAGVQESVLMVVMSLAMLFMLARAWTQARARRFAEHREWMIRLFGLSFFIALQRLYGTPMFLLTDWPQREAFMTSTVLAVVTAAVTAEWWINVSRDNQQPSPRPAVIA